MGLAAVLRGRTDRWYNKTPPVARRGLVNEKPWIGCFNKEFPLRDDPSQ